MPTEDINAIKDRIVNNYSSLQTNYLHKIEQDYNSVKDYDLKNPKVELYEDFLTKETQKKLKENDYNHNVGSINALTDKLFINKKSGCIHITKEPPVRAELWDEIADLSQIDSIDLFKKVNDQAINNDIKNKALKNIYDGLKANSIGWQREFCNKYDELQKSNQNSELNKPEKEDQSSLSCDNDALVKTLYDNNPSIDKVLYNNPSLSNKLKELNNIVNDKVNFKNNFDAFKSKREECVNAIEAYIEKEGKDFKSFTNELCQNLGLVAIIPILIKYSSYKEKTNAAKDVAKSIIEYPKTPFLDMGKEQQKENELTSINSPSQTDLNV
ncbi:hypothetical protein L3V82_03990 [Thiotrichales bacterium 19S3-7]|nr:hypothetical protein [Thiotrichales bacterium 19S3-7]MCF6801835.1 hypothetical protein [Thiotrichales bacterium 19S3-11]